MRTRSREAGLTIIELLVALALLGFVLIGIVPLFIGSVKSNFSANEYTSIHMLARDRLEQLMNLPFTDPKLAPGLYVNDQPLKLPDPKNPSILSMVPNPFQITYQMMQFQIPNADIKAGVVANGAPFTPTRITAAGAVYQYKRIDVTVTSGAGPLGIGARVSRVSGCLNNPSPGTILSVVDTGP